MRLRGVEVRNASNAHTWNPGLATASWRMDIKLILVAWRVLDCPHLLNETGHKISFGHFRCNVVLVTAVRVPRGSLGCTCPRVNSSLRPPLKTLKSGNGPRFARTAYCCFTTRWCYAAWKIVDAHGIAVYILYPATFFALVKLIYLKQRFHLIHDERLFVKRESESTKVLLHTYVLALRHSLAPSTN